MYVSDVASLPDKTPMFVKGWCFWGVTQSEVELFDGLIGAFYQEKELPIREPDGCVLRVTFNNGVQFSIGVKNPLI